MWNHMEFNVFYGLISWLELNKYSNRLIQEYSLHIHSSIIFISISQSSIFTCIDNHINIHLHIFHVSTNFHDASQSKNPYVILHYALKRHIGTHKRFSLETGTVWWGVWSYSIAFDKHWCFIIWNKRQHSLNQNVLLVSNTNEYHSKCLLQLLPLNVAATILHLKQIIIFGMCALLLIWFNFNSNMDND